MNRSVPRKPEAISSLEGTHSEIGVQWESFVSSSTDFEMQPQHPILQSWLRCKQSRVDPYLSRSPIVLPENEAAELCEVGNLLRAAVPILEEVAPVMIEAGQVVALANEEGTLLKVYARPDVWDSLREIRYVVGANWSEEITGTNGCGTALKTLQPMHIVGSEHFCKSWHAWVCSAAPIFDPKTRHVLGVLEASVCGVRSNSCSLAAVVAMTAAIEQQLEKLHWIRDQHIIDRYHEIADSRFQNAVLALNDRSHIIKFSPGAVSLLGVDPKAGSPESLESLLGTENSARLLGKLADKSDGFELPLVSNGRDYWLTCHSVHLDSKRVGSVIVIDPRGSRSRPNLTPEKGSVKYVFEDLIGESPAFLESLSVARIAAQNDLAVLISGESGTGKEMIAESIHQASSRVRGPFVAVNCAAIPSELICSELFGYAEGAYTGAKRSGNAGKFEAANGGTLFLDEISDLSRSAQAALLRVLQEMEITRLGSHRVIPLDVRIIAATNADLYQMAAEENFRSDLLHRLNVLSLTMPPLRERLEDVEPLANTFLKAACLQLRKPALCLDSRVLKCFLRYRWPGNVRELKNVIQRAAALASGRTITLKELPAQLAPAAPAAGRADTREVATSIQAQERQIILQSLAACRGNFSLAASQLGLGRSTLYRKLKKYGIQRSWKME